MKTLWIRVDQQLPRAFAIVLGLVVDSENLQAAQPVVWTRIDWRFEPSGQSVSGSGSRVTHWQPLPEPPALDEV